MAHIVHVATLDGAALPSAVGLSDFEIFWFENLPYVYAGAFADGSITRMRLRDGTAAEVLETRPGTAATGTLGLNDLQVVEVAAAPLLLGAGVWDDRPALRALDPDTGQTGALQQIAPGDVAVDGLSQLTTFGDGAFVAAAQRGAPGLQAFSIGADFALGLTDTAVPAPKTTLADVTALETVAVNGAEFVVAASALEPGLTVLRAGAGGTLDVVDTLPAAAGPGMAGVTGLGQLEVGGRDFVIAASGPAGTLSVFRLNPMGVLFETDHVLDTLDTRFDGAQDVATFTAAGRGFVVTGGADDGLSLFELAGDGRLFHMGSIANAPGHGLEGVQTLAAAVMDGTAQILVAGSAPGLAQFRIDLDDIAPAQAGTNGADALAGDARDDFLTGGAGNDTLSGGPGDDRLIGGPGADVLTGGPGADTFVFGTDGATDRVTDFRPGTDRLDLADWGRVHSMTELQITPRSDGARIAFEGFSLILRSHDLSPLDPGDFVESDFVFL